MDRGYSTRRSAGERIDAALGPRIGEKVGRFVRLPLDEPMIAMSYQIVGGEMVDARTFQKVTGVALVVAALWLVTLSVLLANRQSTTTVRHVNCEAGVAGVYDC